MGTFELLTQQEICIELGKRCRRLRLQVNLTQLELAERAGVSLSSIRRMESHGQATLGLLVRTMQVLNMVNQLENLLVLKTISIADAERSVVARQRKRATAPRRQKP